MSAPDAVSTARLPVLYSFRRCPFAMRARLALLHCGIAVELREVVLRAKPATLLALSPKGTVPVLLLPDGRVLEQSLDIMQWALQDHAGALAQQPWIVQCDGSFKSHLDRYKYPHRYHLKDGLDDRSHGSLFLKALNAALESHDNLGGPRWGMVDAAIAPFVRQWAHTDPQWWQDQPWPALQRWLERFESSQAFAAIMTKFAPWSEGNPPVVWPESAPPTATL